VDEGSGHLARVIAVSHCTAGKCLVNLSQTHVAHCQLPHQ
jgi:hypothetical protein